MIRTAFVRLAEDVLAGPLEPSVRAEVNTEGSTLVKIAGRDVSLVGDLVDRRNLVGGDVSNDTGLNARGEGSSKLEGREGSKDREDLHGG